MQTTRFFLFLLLALSLCGACTDHQSMQKRLVYVSACNRADTVFSARWIPTVDSLVDYFNRHGSANERMMAYYLQGRAHHDMGEAPRALDCYQQAIEQADTTAKECDFYTLAAVYGQMAELFHALFLPDDEIAALKSLSKVSLLDKDTLNEIIAIYQLSRPYFMRGDTDSVLIVEKQAHELFHKYDYKYHAGQAVIGSIRIELNRHNIPEAERLLNIYRNESGLFDNDGNLVRTSAYYVDKGIYMMHVGTLDSAQYYFRKAVRIGFYEGGYRGLLSVYEKMNLPDSIAKYARLFAAANDSSIAIKSQELTARLAASYRYNTIQREALAHKREANQARIALVAIITGIVLVAIIVVFCAFQYKKKKEQELKLLKTKYAESVDAFNRNQEALRIINDTRKTTIDRLRQHLTDMEEDLRTENDQLKETIDVLRQQANMRQTTEKAQEFFANPIIERVKQVANTPQQMLTKTDKKQLLSTTSQYYPKLINHLNRSGNITPQSIYVCILVGLNLRSAEISNLLGISEQQVSNHKKAINDVLFGEDTARTLYKNLVAQYGMCAV